MYFPNNKITLEVFGFTKKKPGSVAIVSNRKIKNNGKIEFTKLVIPPAINNTNSTNIKYPLDNFIIFSSVMVFDLK